MYKRRNLFILRIFNNISGIKSVKRYQEFGIERRLGENNVEQLILLRKEAIITSHNESLLIVVRAIAIILNSKLKN